MTSRLLLLLLTLVGYNSNNGLLLVQATSLADETQENVRTALQRRVALGRFRPSEEDLAAPLPSDRDLAERELLTLKQTCTIILDSYIGKTGVERLACQAEDCRINPQDRNEYILSCDFTDICNFCSPQDDTCYTLTHEYIVRPWRGDIRQNEDIAYSACGTYHFGGREKVCLDETYKNWGYLDTQCVSVDDVSCNVCQINPQCGSYIYKCGNIEPRFWMDGCDYAFNDKIPKSSVFVGFNYGMYAEDTSTCFDGDGTGNIPAGPPPTPRPTPRPTLRPTPPPTESPTASPTTSPTLEPTQAIIAAPTGSPTEAPTNGPTLSPPASPTEAPTAGPTLTPTEVPTGSIIVQTETPTVSPTVAPTAGPTTLPATEAPVRSIIFKDASTEAPTRAPVAGDGDEATTLTPTLVPTSSTVVQSSPRPTVASRAGDGDEATTSAPTAVPRSGDGDEATTSLPTSVPVSGDGDENSPSTTLTPTLVPTSNIVAEEDRNSTAFNVTSLAPSLAPSLGPSLAPSLSPSSLPTDLLSANPSGEPSTDPSSIPSNVPSGQPSEAPTGMPSSTPTLSMVPSASPTQQTVVALDDFSMTVSFPDNATLDTEQMTAVMEVYLHTAFLKEYDNLNSIDLETGNRRRLTQSDTILFSGEATFFGEAPLPSAVQTSQAASLDDTESLQAALEPYDVVLESIAVDDSSGASLTGVATSVLLVCSCVMGLFFL